MVLKVQSNLVDLSSLHPAVRHQAYNAMDSALTVEIEGKLNLLLSESPNATGVYQHSRDFSAPALEMMLRGILIDIPYQSQAVAHGLKLRTKLQDFLNQMAFAVWGQPLNPQSPKQLQTFFYHVMRLPPQWHFDKGVKKLSTDREALEALSSYLLARPICNLILALRDISKTLAVLTTPLGTDGRMRTSYNVAGTETGRLSSSGSAFRDGTNLQNITGRLRRMFIADAGKKFIYSDLEQAESRAVGIIVWMLFDDDTYLQACEAGDLHTTVCKMVWPELPWTGELKHDKKIVAGQLFYRDFSYRDMAKRGGHGTNYYGQPQTMAMHLKVEKSIMEEFQLRYFSAFPGIRRWHQWVATTLQSRGILTTFMGRERQFFSRLDDKATLRAAIAFEPQSCVADIMDKGILNLWNLHLPGLEFLGQVHDAVWLQYPEADEASLLPLITPNLVFPITLTNLAGKTRTFSIPVEMAIGWNWDKHGEKNPDGLLTTTSDTRTRTGVASKSLLHRVLY